MCESRKRVQQYRVKRRKLEELRQFTCTSVTKTSREKRQISTMKEQETHKNETYVSSKEYFILYLFYLFYSCYYNINFIT